MVAMGYQSIYEFIYERLQDGMGDLNHRREYIIYCIAEPK